MTKAHLILNPQARGVTPALKRVVEAALEGRFDLQTTSTLGVDDAIDVARKACEQGAEVIIAFGGDGLVNEVVNGLAGSGASLAVIPGGTMNVFARNIGLPKDPLEATDRILSNAGARKTVRLGLAGDRYFLFACGCGFDADAAMRVDHHRAAKRRYGEPYFYAAAFATFLGSYFRKRPFLTCTGSEGSHKGVMAVALNGGPYAYLAGRPVVLTAAPDLEVFVLRRLRYRHIPLYAMGAWSTSRFGPDAASIKAPVTITGSSPFAIHVDGELLAPTDTVRIEQSETIVEVVI